MWDAGRNLPSPLGSGGRVEYLLLVAGSIIQKSDSVCDFRTGVVLVASIGDAAQVLRSPMMV